MRKSVAVFSYDRNPACDPPNFHITQFEAADRVEKGYAYYINFHTIQHRPPVDWTLDERQTVISNLVKEAWKPRWSADYVVLQLQSTNYKSE